MIVQPLGSAKAILEDSLLVRAIADAYTNYSKSKTLALYMLCIYSALAGQCQAPDVEQR